MDSRAIIIHGRYQLSARPLGQGGMGVVYKAYDLATKRFVALKSMRGALSPSALELFNKEWSVLAQLSHPNIVDVLDTGDFEQDNERRPFFVMPFLPGTTLEQLMKSSSTRLTLERIVGIVAQTCRGLQAAHEQGVIHRDLKPSNIFVMDDDAVKIIDFGIVHLVGADTVTGLKGTLQYMAPEQIEMRPSSAASDIFSLAVVCYEALTGRKPFARKTDVETAEAVRRYTPPPIFDLNPLVSQLVSRVIHKAMAKDPRHRFSTAKEYSEALQKAQRGEALERFDPTRIQPRIDRVKKAQAGGDHQFASEILSELEAEGNIDPEMSLLRIQIDQAVRQKSIRQLLESARTRLEEDEFPLALQKIQEVLTIDPDNPDAVSLRSAVEKQRSQRQTENWFRLVDQHIHNSSFVQAREGLGEILKLNPNDSKARELLVDLDLREKEVERTRNEKEQLYKSALNSYQHSDVSSALTKLERILELTRRSPDSTIPDRDAQYQNLYNQIRTERDAAQNAYAEGQRYLVERKFDKALKICNEFLQKAPGDPMFQALKLEAEEQQRQNQSGFIAEVSRRAESERDLDRRVNILKEAVERYPEEPHLQQSLRLMRERRDLVNSIVERARQYEESGQFNEALSQFDILRNIYSQYPGIEFETERLKRRRDSQIREESKGRWVEQIDRQIAVGDYGRARELARTALAEFPEDRELVELERLAEGALERTAEAEEWLQRGQKLCFDRQFGEGLEALRKAASLDNRNAVIRVALSNALIEQARSLLAQDWRAAEPLIEQALNIDGGHPLAKSLQGLVLDYKRQEILNDCVSQAREMQANGDLIGALTKVEDVLVSYPNEVRLVQLRATLRNLGAVSRTAPVTQAQSDNKVTTTSKPYAPLAQTETVFAVKTPPALVESTFTIDRSMADPGAAAQAESDPAKREPGVQDWNQSRDGASRVFAPVQAAIARVPAVLEDWAAPQKWRDSKLQWGLVVAAPAIIVFATLVTLSPQHGWSTLALTRVSIAHSLRLLLTAILLTTVLRCVWRVWIGNGIASNTTAVLTVTFHAALGISCLVSWLPQDHLVGPLWLLLLPMCVTAGLVYIARGSAFLPYSIVVKRNSDKRSPFQTGTSDSARVDALSRSESAQRSDSSTTIQRQHTDTTVYFPTRESIPKSSAEARTPTRLVSKELTSVFLATSRQLSDNTPASPNHSTPPSAGLTISNCIDTAFIGRKVEVKSFPFDIGRNAAWLKFDRAVSGRHAEIEFQNGEFVIKDLSSANGTFVNGKQIPSGTWERISFGSRILLGTHTELLFVLNDLEEIPDLTGTLIDGRYILTEKLHATAKSVVYRADDRRLNQPVAVKILSPHLVSHAGYREQFDRDAQIASKLRHPHICRVLDFGETQLEIAGGTRTLYVCTEYLSGGSLSERLNGSERFSLARTSSWLDRICSALEYLHRNRVVHGGIKPSSIIFDSDDQPSLTDFALSTKAGSETLRVVIGAPAYLAPEQWTGGEPLPATDQYSLAVTVYRVITGSLPHEGQEYAHVRRTNLLRSPIPAHCMAEHNGYLPIPEVLSCVLERAMSLTPGNRFASASEFASAFKLALTSTAHTSMRPGNSKVTGSTGKPFRNSIFVSYSHSDIRWLNKLKTMLRPLEREGGLVLWDDSRIKPGERWKEEIQAAIASAKVAVLLVSPEFLASEFVTKDELPPILEASEKEGLRILWIPVSDCLYNVTAISRYQAAWDPSRPLTKLRGAKVQEALASIAKAVGRALDSV
jgi:serine/threonine protein kinase